MDIIKRNSGYFILTVVGIFVLILVIIHIVRTGATSFNTSIQSSAKGEKSYTNGKYSFKLKFPSGWQENGVFSDDNFSFINSNDSCVIYFAGSAQKKNGATDKKISFADNTFVAGGESYKAQFTELNDSVIRFVVLGIPDQKANHELGLYSAKGENSILDSKCVEDLRKILGTLEKI